MNDKNFFNLMCGNEPDQIILHSRFKKDFYGVANGDFSFDETIFVTIKSGWKLYDILCFDDGVNIVISQKFYDLLRKSKITGWKCFPIVIKELDKKYYGFQIIGKAGELVEPESTGSYTGFKFDFNEWDSSDIFSPKKTHLRFISERFKNLIVENSISNVSIENIEDSVGFSFGNER